MTALLVGLAALIICGGAAALIGLKMLKDRRTRVSYQRSLDMVPLVIHLPPSAEDLDGGSRDERDITDEVISQAQSMYGILASTFEQDWKQNLVGQEHLSFELVAADGLIYYYAVVPIHLIDTVRQAVTTAYPAARLERVTQNNIFNKSSGLQGVAGGELTLKDDYTLPIATYKDTKQDASRAILNALAAVKKEDGASIQILFRPANPKWTSSSKTRIKNIREHKTTKSGGDSLGQFFSDLSRALWTPPEVHEGKETTTVTETETAEIEGIDQKSKYAGFEVLIRVIASTESAERSKILVGNVVSAFALFDSPQANGFKYDMHKDIDELATDYLLRTFPVSQSSNILNSVELASVFHLPSQKDIPTSQVKRQATKQVDGPTEVVEEGLILGVNEFRGEQKIIRLSPKDRLRHTYIIGQTGTGKSVMLKNLAYQDLMEGRGFALIDPHGDLAEDLLGLVPPERVEDVIYFNPSDKNSPVGLNMFEISDPDQMDFVIGEMMSMLYSLFDPQRQGIVGPRMENIVRNAAILLMSDPDGGTFMDIPKVLIDPEFTKSKLKHVTNPRAIDFWTKEWPAAQKSNDAGEVTSWVVSKWAPFENELLRNILGQVKSGFNIREVMDNKKILLVNLSKGLMGEQAAKLLGMVFVMKFQAAAMSRADTPEDQRQEFCLYVDEFQNFATDSFESILSEARKYKLNLILANQFMTQLTDNIREAIIGNVGTVISGRIGITDAEILQKKFAPTFSAEDLTKLPNFNAVTSVLIHSVPSAPFSLTWTYESTPSSDSKLQQAVATYSATRYGRPREEVAAEIATRLSIKKVAEAMGSAVRAGEASSHDPSSELHPATNEEQHSDRSPVTTSVSDSERRRHESGQNDILSDSSALERPDQEPDFLARWQERKTNMSNLPPEPETPPRTPQNAAEDHFKVGDSDDQVIKLR